MTMSTAVKMNEADPQQPLPEAAGRIHEVPPPQPIVKQRMGLYDLTIEGLEIERALIESDGELSPELEARFDVMLQQGPKAIDGAAAIVRELVVSQAAAKAEKDRQQAREKSFERNAKSLKSRIRVALDAAFNGKLKTDRFNLFTSKGRTSTKVEFLGDLSTLENLYNTRPDVVTEVKSYVVNDEAILTIWEAEKPARQAHNDAMSTWRGLLEAAGDDKVLYGLALAQEPPAFESKIPAVIQVNITEGERSLTIK